MSGYPVGMADVTHILSQIEHGDPHAAEKLLPLVYDELRKLAAAKLTQEKPGQTLQATALVHEAYLRLVEGNSQPWGSSRHFFAAAAESMRRILIDQSRRKRSVKHGGQRRREEMPEVAVLDGNLDDLLAVDGALTKLAMHDSLAAELVKLRFFAGLSMDEAAQVLGVSSRTAYYTWAYARSWLHRAIAGESPSESEQPQKLPP